MTDEIGSDTLTCGGRFTTGCQGMFTICWRENWPEAAPSRSVRTESHMPVTFMAAVAIIGAVLSTAPIGQNPGHDEPAKVFVDHEAPPPTLDGAWRSVPIVVHVRVATVTDC